MRKLALTATAAAFGLGLAAPAFAQDGPPPARDDATFTGPRVGVILGYDKLQPGRGPNSSISSDRKADGLT
ncbi:porin family protein, partial [Pseudomonas sp. FW305-130]